MLGLFDCKFTVLAIAGAGPFYVAHFVPYTPANYATHQPPPGAFAYPAGMPTPGPVLGMLAPTNGHASQHMLPMGPYAYQQPGPPYMHNAIGPPSHNPGTWAPQSGNWPMQGGYAATKVSSTRLKATTTVYRHCKTRMARILLDTSYSKPLYWKSAADMCALLLLKQSYLYFSKMLTLASAFMRALRLPHA